MFDRVSDFLGTLMRDFEKTDFPPNVVIVTHGMALRLFLMRWFHWTVEQFEEVLNPTNCQVLLMEKATHGKYGIMTPMQTQVVQHKYQRPLKY